MSEYWTRGNVNLLLININQNSLKEFMIEFPVVEVVAEAEAAAAAEGGIYSSSSHVVARRLVCAVK